MKEAKFLTEKHEDLRQSESFRYVPLHTHVL
jgi:hypothetical protein